jgi:hypothetical protein
MALFGGKTCLPCLEQNESEDINKEFLGVNVPPCVKKTMDWCFCFFSAPRCKFCHELYDQSIELGPCCRSTTFTDEQTEHVDDDAEAAENSKTCWEIFHIPESLAKICRGRPQECCQCLAEAYPLKRLAQISKLAQFLDDVPILDVVLSAIIFPFTFISAIVRKDRNQMAKAMIDLFIPVVVLCTFMIPGVDAVVAFIAALAGLISSPIIDWFISGRCDKCHDVARSVNEQAYKELP